MTPDVSYSLLGVVVLIGIITQKQIEAMVLEGLLVLTRPIATIALFTGLVFLYHRGLHYSFLVASLIVVFLLKDLWTNWVNADARRLRLEIGRDQDRFDHATSIDLQFADGTVKHESPPMYYTRDLGGLLVFPPSDETLAEMSG